MKTKGALILGPGRDWEIAEFDLGDPIAGEVQVRLAAAGLCHSDDHLRTGDQPPPFYPVLGGHEGAGIVTKVGANVTGLREGDHVVLSFIAACGRCRACARGRQHLCDRGASIGTGRSIADGTYRAATRSGHPIHPMTLLGAFAPYVTVHQDSVIKIEDDIPLDRAVLVSCGVCTGWGSAVHAGGTQPGDAVVVIGCGGIGMNAIQGAAMAGARFVFAIDPVAFKREQALKFGATHVFSSLDEAASHIQDLTWGALADVVVLAVGVLEPEMIQSALSVTAKGGTVAVTAVGPAGVDAAAMSLIQLTALEKRVQGVMFGGASPRAQVPKLLNLYRNGALKLDELVTRTYRLEDITVGYRDMLEGRNIRGIIEFTDSDY
ncbi:NDMA-dependent alcohol dehydrogenase [Nocardia spumae]|uniref:NDMA-dependent alcohol dehydrogenase n=1 Tax=Nocardia spumae TaxID=2887190 RepID=UPI001D13F2D3|nr:NDMA-dependent alcohol dehydrogenase [Nocardia spumae]